MCICNDLHDAQGDEDSTAVAEMEEQFSNMKAIPHDHRLLVYVIGCPGSGKGTLCKLLVQNHGYRHVSVGDLLRGLVDGQSKPNDDVKDYVQQGNASQYLEACCHARDLGVYPHRWLPTKVGSRHC